MTAWLVYLEPEKLEVLRVEDSWSLVWSANWADKAAIYGLGNQTAADQGALFNLAYQIADTRGLEFRIHKCLPRAAPVPGHFAPMPTLQINMTNTNSDQKWVNLEIHEGFEHIGYHMADALLRALGAIDWQTREPERVQP